jgi:multidrug efflux pump subunit AcrB
VALLLAACALVPLKRVMVKMLPFDNKSEFQIIIDMPEGTPLERTAAVTREIAAYVQTVPEVANFQTYVGTASPHNFNGLVRHYFLRANPHEADIQVNLAPKDHRKAQSHDIAKRVRPHVAAIAQRYGARIKVAEVPPGPPVLQTLVAEIYGPDYERQLELAKQVRAIFEQTEGVVDVDSYVEDDQAKQRIVVDPEKAALHGVSVAQVTQTLKIALGGLDAGLVHQPAEKEDVPIHLRLARQERSSLHDLLELKVMGDRGNPVSLSQLVRVEEVVQDKSIYHKNLMPVVYVTGDVGGEAESPVYVIFDLMKKVEALDLPEGYAIDQYSTRQPFSSEKLALKWDGEWFITYEVFRDMGLAFAAVLVLIFILVVGWFQSLKTPFVIMAAIPFSLVGILPAHMLMGAFFTATSMIGFIAGAGIVVRNSIILVDFIELRLAQGMPLAEAVVDAGAVRFRPMLLTASAVVVGASVILFDPIFQGLALSLMAGEIASLLLSRMAVPILYYLSRRGELKRAAAPAPQPDDALPAL